MTHKLWATIAQNLRSICFQAFLGAFLLQVQGVPVNPYVQRVQNMNDKGGQGVKNAWLRVTFNQSPAIGKGLIKSRP